MRAFIQVFVIAIYAECLKKIPETVRKGRYTEKETFREASSEGEHFELELRGEV